MPATPLDSEIYKALLGDVELRALFTDSADVRAMLVVEGTLAKVQGDLGVIPEESAKAIHRASLELQIDPAALAPTTGQNAVPVPALVAAFRKEMNAPEHAQFVHWGATSQDIIDTALALRVKRVLELFEARLSRLLSALADLSGRHATLPLAARTYGQVATVTSFGALTAGWGRPLLEARGDLSRIRNTCLNVSLSGAAGTLAAMGSNGPEIRAGLADGLGLSVPDGSWHSDRRGPATLAAWLTLIAGALGKLGHDLHQMAQSGVEEITFSAGGRSSTMPQKANPVQAVLLGAIARQIVALNAVVQGGLLHERERDGAAWISEWLSLPQMCLLTGRALSVADEACTALTPMPDAMARNIDPEGTGLIYAEALTFALSQIMPRPEAQAKIAALCTEARETGASLASLVARDHPGDWAACATPEAQLGQAPAEARAFAARVRADG